ncbi:MAG: hypothetical protein B7X28_08260 [Halothiobacillus sp. 13-55-253]|nr:MAG: hypothetical protein B7X28_08260 [Halothiobacillus sp. 13-55-253]
MVDQITTTDTESIPEAIVAEPHHKGRGVCGIFTREIAETRVAQVNQVARQNDHPLLCVMEPAAQ